MEEVRFIAHMKKDIRIVRAFIVVALGALVYFFWSTPVANHMPAGENAYSFDKLHVSSTKIPGPQNIVEESIPPFVAASYLLPRSKDMSVQDIDFEGDGIQEKILYYTSFDNLGDEEYAENQHISVYKWQDSEWLLIKEDVARRGNTVAVDTSISFPEVIDLGEDNKQEMYVQKCSGRYCAPRYYVFGLWEGEYTDWPIPKGYLNAEDYLHEGDTFIHLNRIEYLSAISGFTEQYDVYCEKKIWGMVDFGTDKAVCRSFTLEVNFVEGVFTTRVVSSK